VLSFEFVSNGPPSHNSIFVSSNNSRQAATSIGQLADVLAYIREGCTARGITREIPIHVLIETHGALADVWLIAHLRWIQVLDFGMMDFVSAHNGAIPASCPRSPGQFEHRLLSRAKAEIVAAALANGVVPAHNVCLELKDPDRVHAGANRARMSSASSGCGASIRPKSHRSSKQRGRISRKSTMPLRSYCSYKTPTGVRSNSRGVWTIGQYKPWLCSFSQPSSVRNMLRLPRTSETGARLPPEPPPRRIVCG